jgi:hypothetical protein
MTVIFLYKYVKEINGHIFGRRTKMSDLITPHNLVWNIYDGRLENLPKMTRPFMEPKKFISNPLIVFKQTQGYFICTYTRGNHFWDDDDELPEIVEIGDMWAEIIDYSDGV